MTISTAQSSSTAKLAAPSIPTLLTNLHLLDLDRRDDWPLITAQTFTCKNTLENEKSRIRCVEWALYRLFEIWDPTETSNKLQPFFPPLLPLQSQNLRAALFRCLDGLKKNGTLGKNVILRKTMLDDCKGEKIQDLLATFSTVVLRKVLVDGHGGTASIAGRLAVAEKVSMSEQRSYLPLAIAHRASLTALLRKKRDLRSRYQGFSRTLALRDQELDREFESIVKTQERLDANPVPDYTASKFCKLFVRHWQGDANLLDVIVGGETTECKDSLLDEPFSEVWSKVSEGSFDGSTQITSSKLLKDLEQRVADQEARLNHWKTIKESMGTGIKLPPTNRKIQSSLLARTKSNAPDLQRQRDLVFSPRKSPRKSDDGIRDVENFDSSPTPLPKTLTVDPEYAIADLNLVEPSSDGGIINGADIRSDKREEEQLISLSPQWSASDDTDNSRLSEVSYGDTQCLDGHEHNSLAGTQKSIDEYTKNPQSAINHQQLGTFKTPNKPNHANEDDLSTQQIPAMIHDSDAIPTKPKLSLVDRTRQSILATSNPLLPTLEEAINSLSPLPTITSPTTPSHPPPSSNPKTLLERTRQSISLVPSNLRSHPHHRRRTSKIYPTNQFETPRKQGPQGDGSKSSTTPPEELFSPGAGYDSVFKSRPKVGFSPVGSPVMEGGEMDGSGDGVRDESPTLRVRAREG